MKWWIANDGSNKMHEAIAIEQESFNKVRVQTFSGNFIKDKQWFKEFWLFYLNSEIIDPKNLVGLIDPTNDEGDFEDVTLDPDFELRAFSGSDPALADIFWI